MNILSNLPFLKSNDTVTDEVEAAKGDRIAFHRAKVRNGPASFRTPTNGQIRRERRRELDRRSKKARRKQIQDHFASRREAAILRGNLRAIGVLSYEGQELDPQRALNAGIWIIRHFADGEGSVEVTRSVVMNSLQSALNRYESLHGLPASEIDPSYVLPLALPDEAAA